MLGAATLMRASVQASADLVAPSFPSFDTIGLLATLAEAADTMEAQPEPERRGPKRTAVELARRHHVGKRVQQIDKQTGEVIRTWPSLAVAARTLKLGTGSNIAKVCNGNRNHTGGFKWCYVNGDSVGTDDLEAAADNPSAGASACASACPSHFRKMILNFM